MRVAVVTELEPCTSQLGRRLTPTLSRETLADQEKGGRHPQPFEEIHEARHSPFDHYLCKRGRRCPEAVDLVVAPQRIDIDRDRTHWRHRSLLEPKQHH